VPAIHLGGRQHGHEQWYDTGRGHNGVDDGCRRELARFSDNAVQINAVVRRRRKSLAPRGWCRCSVRVMVMERLAHDLGGMMMVRTRHRRTNRMSRVFRANSLAHVASEGSPDDHQRECESQQTSSHLRSSISNPHSRRGPATAVALAEAGQARDEAAVKGPPYSFVEARPLRCLRRCCRDRLRYVSARE
jgi:hypothetical protein